MAVATAALALCAPAAASAQAPDCAQADTPFAQLDPSSAREAISCLVSVERTGRGLPAYTRDERLAAAAQRHSDDMVARGFFDHRAPDGSQPADRIRAAGYPADAYGENIARGPTPRFIVASWMRSAVHCRNVLSTDFNDDGVGLATSGEEGFATLVLGRRTGATPRTQDFAPLLGCPYAEPFGPPGAGGAPPGAGAGPAPARGGEASVATEVAYTRTWIRFRGLLSPNQSKRRIVITIRRGKHRARKTLHTTAGGRFTARMDFPRGKGAIRVTIQVPAVKGQYTAHSETHTLTFGRGGRR